MNDTFKVIAIPVIFPDHSESKSQFIVNANRAKEFADHNLKLKWLRRGHLSVYHWDNEVVGRDHPSKTTRSLSKLIVGEAGMPPRTNNPFDLTSFAFCSGKEDGLKISEKLQNLKMRTR